MSAENALRQNTLLTITYDALNTLQGAARIDYEHPHSQRITTSALIDFNCVICQNS